MNIFSRRNRCFDVTWRFVRIWHNRNVTPVKIELGSRLGSHWDPALYPTGIFGRDPSPHSLGSQSISHHIPLGSQLVHIQPGSQYTSNRDPSPYPTISHRDPSTRPTGIPVHISPESHHIPPYPTWLGSQFMTGIPVHIPLGCWSKPTIKIPLVTGIPVKIWDIS